MDISQYSPFPILQRPGAISRTHSSHSSLSRLACRSWCSSGFPSVRLFSGLVLKYNNRSCTEPHERRCHISEVPIMYLTFFDRHFNRSHFCYSGFLCQCVQLCYLDGFAFPESSGLILRRSTRTLQARWTDLLLKFDTSLVADSKLRVQRIPRASRRS